MRDRARPHPTTPAQAPDLASRLSCAPTVCHNLGWFTMTVRRQGLMPRELDDPYGDTAPAFATRRVASSAVDKPRHPQGQL